MTLELSNVNNLPTELVNYIYEFNSAYIDYVSKYEIYTWDDFYEIIENTYRITDCIERVYKIVKIIEPTNIELAPNEWADGAYRDYNPRRTYFWDDDDEVTDYSGYNKALIGFLQRCDNLIYTNNEYYSKLNYINDIYKMLLE